MADRRILLRRVTFDLIGLPPTLSEMEAFENDRSADAYAKVVERLLASPRYGEKWARHWLDVARYADTKDGVLMFGADRIRPFAYTYRDYVIRAFNDDLPYDQFINDQLAADQVTPALPSWRLAGLGLLTLGRGFDGNVHDVIDDQIDVVTRGLLGLTVACARCHDHKYDPVPTADYYALHGIFAAAETPLRLPMIDATAKGPESYEKQYADQLARIEKTLDSQYAMLLESTRSRAAEYLLHVATTPADPLETAVFFRSYDPNDLRPPIVHRWRLFLKERLQESDKVFGPWNDFSSLDEKATADEIQVVLAKWRSRASCGNLNPLVWQALEVKPPTGVREVAALYGRLLTSTYQASKKATPSTVEGQELLVILTGHDSPAYFPKSMTRRYMARGDGDAYSAMVLALDKIAAGSPMAPPRAMIVNDTDDILPARILLRGNPARPGPIVPRRFLTVLGGDKQPAFTHGAGRLDLAQAITAADNPLTARVMVNRLWMHHFGEPLVDSPSDFGLRTARPIHLALLDELASNFREGWSIKQLHRLMVMSTTYQQSSQERADLKAIDPDNKLWGRSNRRRLDFEAMRDSLLVVSGQLETPLYGRPFDDIAGPSQHRRSIYALIDRQSLPGVLRAFDFASPDTSAERRSATTVPQQALFVMNSPFVMERAQGLIARPDVATITDPVAKIQRLYWHLYNRQADADEILLGQSYLQAIGNSKSKLSAWEQYAQVLLLANEMIFVD